MKLSFGWQTALLLEASAVLLSLSYSLWRSLLNRKASQTLAMLLVVLAGIFTPWTIGYAGFYDRWKWLTFLPVSVPLWVPALLYLYVHSLLHGSWPKGAHRLLLPGALEFAYHAVSFCLPLALKLRWADAVWHIAGSIFGSALIVGFVLQTYFSMKEITIYKKAAADALSSDSREATQWLERSLVAFACLWIAWAAAIIADAVRPIGYGGFLLLYLLIAVFAIYLAVEGWRHTLLPFPILSSLQPSSSAAPPSQGKDWQTRGELWAATLRQEGWVRDPDLTLAALARKLGTNTAYLSRALNEAGRELLNTSQ